MNLGVCEVISVSFTFVINFFKLKSGVCSTLTISILILLSITLAVTVVVAPFSNSTLRITLSL